MNFKKDIEGVDMISFFAGHPTKIRAEQFWDFNFYEGANPVREELQLPVLRPAESMVTARKNFKRLMQFLKDQEGIEIVTIRELMEKYSSQPESIKKEDLMRIAERIKSSNHIVYDDDYSPADVFSALVRSLQEFRTSGKIPGKLQRISPLGPMSMPPETPWVKSVSLEQAIDLAVAAGDTIRNLGYLPACLQEGEGCIGTGTLMHLFSSVFLDISSKKQQDTYELISFDPYPKENEEEIISEVEDLKYWIVHRPDLDMSHLIEMTKMQLWTLKPAHEK
jgi:hypothetical protein